MRHLCLSLALILASAASLSAQSTPLALSDTDVREVIAYYKTSDPAGSLVAFSRRMPSQVTDKTFRASIHRQLPTALTSLALKHADLSDALRDVLKPILSVYERSFTYDLILIDTATPLMMSDSGVVLLVSTGMILRAKSDDELLGYAAHEIGHEFFAAYSVYSNQVLRLVAISGKEPVLLRRLREVMAIIELQCDAFASLTLASLGYNPLEFAKGLERTRLDFPGQFLGNHPAETIRTALIKGIVPPGALGYAPHHSAALQHLTELILKIRK